AALVPGQDIAKARLRVGLGPNQHLALIDNLGEGPKWFLHPAPDGSTLAVSDHKGNVVEGYAYSAYGETSFVDPRHGVVAGDQFSKIGNRFLFQSQLYDPALGLYFMRSREFKPSWGRFLSPDPIGLLGGTNLYAFVSGAPLTRSDPLGLSEKQNTGVGKN